MTVLLPITGMAAVTELLYDDFDSYTNAASVVAVWGRCQNGAVPEIFPAGSGNTVIKLAGANTADLQIRNNAGTHYGLIKDRTDKIIMSVDVYGESDLTSGTIMEVKTGSSDWPAPFIITGGVLKSLNNVKTFDMFDSQWHNLMLVADMGGTNKPAEVYIDGKLFSSGTLGSGKGFEGVAFKNGTAGTDYYIDNYQVYSYTADASVMGSFALNNQSVIGTPTDVPVSGSNVKVMFSDPYINAANLSSAITITPTPPSAAVYSFKDGTAKIDFPALASGETYTINLTAGVKTVFGQAVTPNSMSFTTVSGANTPPFVSITAPADGTKYIPGETVNITADSSDSDGTVASVEFFDGAVSLGVDTQVPYTAALSNISAGSHMIKAVATDDKGAASEDTVTIISSVNQNPVVEITFPGDDVSFEQGDDMIITGTASDPDSDGITKVEIYKNDNYLGDAVYSGGSFSYQMTSLEIGEPEIKAVAYDGRGGSAFDTISLNVFAEIVTGYKTVFRSDFTGYQGGAPAGWSEKNDKTPGTRLPVIIDSQYGRDYGTSMELMGVDGTGNVGVEYILSTGLTGNVVFEASVYLYQTTNNLPLFYVQHSGTAPKYENFTLQFNKDGYIKIGKNQASGSAGTENLMTYSKDQWYDVRIEMNLNTKKQTIYINDMVFDNLPIANIDIPAIKYVNIHKWDGAGGAVIDNLSILQGLPATAVTGKVFKNVNGDVIANPLFAPDNTKTIEITFADNMRAEAFTAGNISFKDPDGDNVLYNGIYADKKYTVTINSPLKEGSYKLSFNDNVVDERDVSLSLKHRNIEFNVVTGFSVLEAGIYDGDASVENLAGLSSVKVKCEIQNNSSQPIENAVYVVVSYKNGILTEAKSVRLDIAAYSTASPYLTVSLAGNDDTNYKVRAYAWGDFTNMIPLVSIPFMQ